MVTVTGLDSTSANPYNFTVTGKSNNQSSSVSLTIFFADFSMTATPVGTAITAGSKATYTITVSPKNGFNLPVLLSCPGAFPGIPIGAACFWSPPSVTPTGVVGSTVTSTLTITTLAQSHIFPHIPHGGPPAGLTRWILLLAMLAFLSAMLASLSRSRLWMRPHMKLAILLTAIVLTAFAVGCEDYVNPIDINPVVNGTPSGNYTIVLTGELGDGSGVTRNAIVNLTVAP